MVYFGPFSKAEVDKTEWFITDKDSDGLYVGHSKLGFMKPSHDGLTNISTENSKRNKLRLS